MHHRMFTYHATVTEIPELLSYTAPHVMASSRLRQLWSSNWGYLVFASHTCRNKHKQNASTIFERCVAFHTRLSSRLDSNTYAPTTHAETNTNKMRPQSSSTVRRFTRVYLHAQTAVHMHLKNQGYFDRRKKRTSPIEAPCRKMAQVLGSPGYICVTCTATFCNF